MVVTRGEIWWANLPEPMGSEPGFPHPIIILQSDDFNRTKLNTVIGAVITTNLRLADMPGNLLLNVATSGLTKDSVVNVTQIVTIDKRSLIEHVSRLADRKMEQLDVGIRLVLSL